MLYIHIMLESNAHQKMSIAKRNLPTIMQNSSKANKYDLRGKGNI